VPRRSGRRPDRPEHPLRPAPRAVGAVISSTVSTPRRPLPGPDPEPRFRARSIDLNAAAPAPRLRARTVDLDGAGRYGGTAAPRAPQVVAEVPATPDVVAEDIASGFCGAVTACTASTVTLEDFKGRTRTFPLDPASFAIDGEVVTLIRPKPAPAAAVRRSASGSLTVQGHTARTARAARIWVEGIHDAALVERVWGHDLRVEGIVVEPIDGLDNLAARLDEFGPSRQRRVGVLCDHLVAGSKESRIAESISRRPDAAAVLVTGHPYIDIWQAVRPAAVRIPAWPEVPRGEDWKHGVCTRLGISDPSVMWGRVNGSVRTFRDVQTPLITAVERLIDFVTAVPE
jgi:hypothetical protein